MQQVAVWLAGARHRPILLAAVLFAVPILTPLAAGLVAFVTILRGPREGAIAALSAVVLLALYGWIAGGAAAPLYMTALMVLPAVVGVAVLTAAYASMSLAFQAAALIAAAIAAIVGTLAQGSEFAVELGAAIVDLALATGLAQAEAQLLAQALVDVLFGLALSGLLLIVMVALALGCWLAGEVQERALLRPQFHRLTLGRLVTVIASLTVVAAVLGGIWAINATVVFFAAFLVQGLAVAHSFMARRNLHPLWLVLIYAALLVPTPLAPLAAIGFAALGYADNWLKLRERGNPSAPPPSPTE